MSTNTHAAPAPGYPAGLVAPPELIRARIEELDLEADCLRRVLRVLERHKREASQMTADGGGPAHAT